MAPLIHAVILTLVLVQSLHVYCTDFIVRPIASYGSTSKPVYRPNDHQLKFFNDWYSKPFNYQEGPLELRCYAILYYTRDKPKTIEIRRTEVSIGNVETLQFYVRPGAIPYGWRIECDYRNRVASDKARKGGIVLISGRNDWRCLVKNEGCLISFVRGEVRRISRWENEFLGELPETKCTLGIFCREREHPNFVFGEPCPGACNF